VALRVLVRGVGDIGSAVAQRLFLAGHGVVVHDGEQPTIARIDETSLTVPLSGVLRGLTHDGVPVTAGTKVIEIDPRGDSALVRGIGERPARIADGVLRAIDAARRTA
jgi:xanthine dehydrogenase accessory factor